MFAEVANINVCDSRIPFSFRALERFSRQMPGRQIQGETRIHFLGDTVFLELRSIKYKMLKDESVELVIV